MNISDNQTVIAYIEVTQGPVRLLGKTNRSNNQVVRSEMNKNQYIISIFQVSNEGER